MTAPMLLVRETVTVRGYGIEAPPERVTIHTGHYLAPGGLAAVLAHLGQVTGLWYSYEPTPGQYRDIGFDPADLPAVKPGSDLEGVSFGHRVTDLWATITLDVVTDAVLSVEPVAVLDADGRLTDELLAADEALLAAYGWEPR